MALGLVLAGPALSAKPKPWMWTPQKASQALRSTVLHYGENGLQWDLSSATCRGQGKGVQRRYVAFRCATVYRERGVAATGRVRKVVVVKIRRVGRGSICAGIGVVPSGCLARGPRAPGSLAEVQRSIMREITGPILAYLRCTSHGSGFYLCDYRYGKDGVGYEGRASVTFSPGPIVREL